MKAHTQFDPRVPIFGEPDYDWPQPGPEHGPRRKPRRSRPGPDTGPEPGPYPSPPGPGSGTTCSDGEVAAIRQVEEIAYTITGKATSNITIFPLRNKPRECYFAKKVRAWYAIE